MPNTLFIRPLQLNALLPSEEKKYEWALYDIAGTFLKYNASTSLDIIDQTLMQNGLDHVDLIGLLPSYAALCTEVNVPGNQARYIQQALPFAVEDQIAQDIEQMHLVLAEKLKSGSYRVLCVDNSIFAGLFDELNNEELVSSLKAIHLDSDLIDASSSAIKIVLSSASAYISGNHQSISIQNQNLISYLDAVFFLPNDEAEQDDINIEIVLDKSALANSKMLIAEIEQYPHVNINVTESSVTAFEYICSEFFKLKKTPANLCQGAYQLSSKNKGAWTRWRSVAIIAGIGFLLQLGVFVGQGFYTYQQAENISKQALTEYKKSVPTSRNISVAKLPRIIKGQLNQLNSAGVDKLDFLDLLGEAGYQFNANQNKTSLVFYSINYSEQRGELLIELHAKSFDQLESLKKAIVDAGLTAKISSAVQEKDYFKGRISVSGV
tara:strand:+ start:9061 stop:10368 length:1308 start_codon:yes stop_codon:yes gene_type:complete